MNCTLIHAFTLDVRKPKAEGKCAISMLYPICIIQHKYVEDKESRRIMKLITILIWKEQLKHEWIVRPFGSVNYDTRLTVMTMQGTSTMYCPNYNLGFQQIRDKRSERCAVGVVEGQYRSCANKGNVAETSECSI